jgi:tape measure domain-containing protein
MAGVNVKFSAETSGLQRGIKSVRGALQGLAGTVGTVLAPLAAIASVGAALGIAFKAVSLAADMESTETSFATLLGSMTEAKKLLGDIATTAKTTPYGFTDLTASARSLLAVTEKENVTKTLKMIGDLASASQKPITELAAMYAKIKGGDVVQGEDLNMLGDALGGQALQEFAKVLGVDSVKAVRKLASEGKITGATLEQVFINLTSKGGMAFNAMDAQSKTFTGLISTLQDNWEGLLRAFGKPIMLALKPFLEDGISLLESLEQKAQSFGEAIGKAITFLRNAFKEGSVISILGLGLHIAATEFVNIIFRGLSGIGGVLMSIFSGLKDFMFDAFGNSDLWDGVGKKLEVLGGKLALSLNEALPRFMGGGDDDFKKTISDRVDFYNSSANASFALAGASIGASVDKLGQTLLDVPKTFTDGYKGSVDLFDNSLQMDEMRSKWKALSAPPPEPAPEPDKPPVPTPTPTPKAPKVEEVFSFKPILSSLARIGGAQSFTSPLVALQQTANSHLASMDRKLDNAFVATYG